MRQIAGVLEHELDLLAFAHLDAGRAVGHGARPVRYGDFDHTERLLGVAGLTGGEHVAVGMRDGALIQARRLHQSSCADRG